MRVTQFFVLCGMIATTLNVAGCANPGYAFRKRCAPVARVCCCETVPNLPSNGAQVGVQDIQQNVPTLANTIESPQSSASVLASQASRNGTGADSPTKPSYEIIDPQPEAPTAIKYFNQNFASSSPQPAASSLDSSYTDSKLVPENTSNPSSADHQSYQSTPWKALQWKATPIEDSKEQTLESQPANPTEPVMMSPGDGDESNQIDDDADEGWVQDGGSPTAHLACNEPQLSPSKPPTLNAPGTSSGPTLRLQASTHHPERFLSSITQHPELKRGENQPKSNSSAMRPISFSPSHQSLIMDPTNFRPLPSVDGEPNAASELLGATKLDSNFGSKNASTALQPINRSINDAGQTTRLHAIPAQSVAALPPVIRIKLLDSSDSHSFAVNRYSSGLASQSVAGKSLQAESACCDSHQQVRILAERIDRLEREAVRKVVESSPQIEAPLDVESTPQIESTFNENIRRLTVRPELEQPVSPTIER